MNTALWCVWYAAGDVTVPRLVAQELSALVVLAATLVVYRTFRERYLLVWILGWLAYLAANSTFTGGLVGLAPRATAAVAQAAFVLAVGLFATSVLVYSHARKLLTPLLALSLVSVGFAVARALFWPTQATAGEGRKPDPGYSA
jgi:hypothetical protein